MVRTRIAPSPTGFPHIGTIYQVLFDKAWADKNKGRFILRLDDTDQKRFVKRAEKAIYSALEWFKLLPTEGPHEGGKFGPYRQSERLEIYKKYALELVENGNAYYCFCSKERLDKIRTKQQSEKTIPMYDRYCRNSSKDEAQKRVNAGENHVIRMKIPENKTIVVKDLIRGNIKFDSNLIDDQVIIKSDGFATYHLAVVVDDHLMKITHVIRGPEWITSFPKHKLLYGYFGWKMPEFVHTPMISNMDGSKLSKRHGHSSVDWYRKKGFLPQAVLNFVPLLGWSHPNGEEIFSFEEFVKVFDLKDVSALNPKFDLIKLEWMNGQYIRGLSDADLSKEIISWLEYSLNSKYKGALVYESHWSQSDYFKFSDFLKSLDQQKLDLFAQINRERMKKFEDILPLNRFFIEEVSPSLDLLIKQKNASEIKEHLEWVFSRVNSISVWNFENVKSVEAEIVLRAAAIGWKIGEVFYPIRISIVGSFVSPPLFESIYILGKDKVITRLADSIKKLG